MRTETVSRVLKSVSCATYSVSVLQRFSISVCFLKLQCIEPSGPLYCWHVYHHK